MLSVFSDTLTEPPKIFSPASIFSTPINQCSFFDGSLVYDESLCSHFSISRLYHANHAEAVRRASECAEKAEVECVLSTEIGLGFPTAFIFRGRKHASSGSAATAGPRCAECVAASVRPRFETLQFDRDERLLARDTRRVSGRIVPPPHHRDLQRISSLLYPTFEASVHATLLVFARIKDV